MPDFLERFGQYRENIQPGESHYYFSTVRSGLIVALLSIGTLIGALIAAPIADKFGRRPSISFWCLITSIETSRAMERDFLDNRGSGE